MKVLLAVLLAAAPAAPAFAQDAKVGDLVIRNAVMRAVPPGVPNTAGYLTIVNSGSRDDRLESVSCACAKSVEPHLSHVMNGQAMMMPAGPVTVPARGQIRFSPGGYHLMVMGLKSPLKDGGHEDMVLKFQHAGTVTVPFLAETRIETRSAD